MNTIGPKYAAIAISPDGTRRFVPLEEDVPRITHERIRGLECRQYDDALFWYQNNPDEPINETAINIYRHLRKRFTIISQERAPIFRGIFYIRPNIRGFASLGLDRFEELWEVIQDEIHRRPLQDPHEEFFEVITDYVDFINNRDRSRNSVFDGDFQAIITKSKRYGEVV